MVDIAQEIYKASKRLDASGDKLFTLAREYAEAEEKYRHELGIEIMKLRELKIPVNLVGDVARGNLSKLKFDRDIKDMKFKAGRDKVQALQAEISALQTLFNKQSEI